jgi:hypothetical protein
MFVSESVMHFLPATRAFVAVRRHAFDHGIESDWGSIR